MRITHTRLLVDFLPDKLLSPVVDIASRQLESVSDVADRRTLARLGHQLLGLIIVAPGAVDCSFGAVIGADYVAL